jgi:release factor H-coupled RctB family protein
VATTIPVVTYKTADVGSSTHRDRRDDRRQRGRTAT